MKRTILEMSFLNEDNFMVDLGSPSLVYRHCSIIPLSKLEALAKKKKVSVVKILVEEFDKVLSAYFNESEIVITYRVNFGKTSLIECVFERLALRFEVKIIKSKLIFSFYYPEDFSSEKISTDIVYDYERVLRKTLKECDAE